MLDFLKYLFGLPTTIYGITSDGQLIRFTNVILRKIKLDSPIVIK
jgi:hypothetical protein